MKTSNKFTLTRVIAAPLLFALYTFSDSLPPELAECRTIISALLIPLLALAEITDFFDGYYARKHNEVSDFGKMFDPFADVLLHLSMFFAFVLSGDMLSVFFILIMFREFSQNFLRMVAAKKGTAIAARKGGKLKTVFYVASCFVVLLCRFLFNSGILFGADAERTAFFVEQGFFAACLILSYASFIDYLRTFGHVLRESMN